MRLEGKVIMVVGACGRIGRSFCKAFVKEGASVVLSDIDEDEAENLLLELPEHRAIFFEMDLLKPESIDRAIELSVKRFGRLDGCINAAWLFKPEWRVPFNELQVEDLNENLSVNLGGSIILSQRMMKCFLCQGWGNLIHISSIHGIAAPKFEHYLETSMTSPIEYTAMKTGMVGMVRWLAKCFSGKQIRVNCISPGGIMDNQPQEFLKRYRGSCSSKGMLDAADLDGVATFLLSDEAKFINGQNIVVDDGWSL